MSNNDVREPWPRTWQEEIKSEFRKYKKTFLKKPTIQRTMHPMGAYTQYWDYIKERYDLTRAAVDSNVGSPTVRSMQGDLSLVSMQCVLYRMLMEEYGLIDFDSIVELGGGYGNNARFQRRLGFEGPIRILDLPVMSDIQKYFIKENNLRDVSCVSYDEFNVRPETDNALFFATFSLNEIPMDDRIHLTSTINMFKYIFITYKPNSFGMDNIEYFRIFIESLNSLGFDMLDKPHPLTNSKTRIIIGKRND